MFVLNRVLFAGRIMLPESTSLTVNHFSAVHRLTSPRRNSPYSSVDSERYSSLVKSVMSSRVSTQTPESLQAEDDNIYGPVVKAQMPSRTEPRVPKTLHPFLNSDRALETDEPEAGPPARILLNRGQSRAFIPSVTRVLQQTLSPEQIFYLERWKRRMIAELGEEGFKEYSQNVFRQGKLFHSALEGILTSAETWKNRHLSETPGCPPDIQGYIQSISHVLEDVSAVRAIESTVQHGALNYLGIVDCVARYRGVLCVIDWKTSEKPKPFLSNTYDNPVQVAAYAGALNSDANYKYQVENGLIVVAYKDGSPAHAHQVNSELMSEYWKTWLLRLEEFREPSNKLECGKTKNQCVQNHLLPTVKHAGRSVKLLLFGRPWEPC
ncbi:mitochondrial genome maintenance exonuclease 1 isoform X1 [Girardinichthys multiradiatus]|uniref:mitochondrial genome maintenance exonuclease 1 isoform X1 n=1 Tax=Girardinichthys multiradiatus TaxID=208333 RepID=UPI001FAE599A|nr:mitochondrial genome maintenance exonuclease 1 isoform X1 [Girardinichthys multiradiatus]